MSIKNKTNFNCNISKIQKNHIKIIVLYASKILRSRKARQIRETPSDYKRLQRQENKKHMILDRMLIKKKLIAINDSIGIADQI